MDGLRLASVVGIAVGAAVMCFAIVGTRKILALRIGDHRKSWRALFAMMVFFFLGYLATIVLALTAPQKILLLATGLVFAAGASFVYLVVRTGHSTMLDLETHARREQAKSDQLEVTLAEMERLNATLLRSNKELEQFAYIASHDLQEPLRKVKAFGDLLATSYSDKLEGDGLLYISRMQKASERMSSLIDDLLQYSRLSRKQGSFARVDLSAVARDVVSDLQTRIDAAGGRVEIGELPTLDARAVQMRQLLQNLIANGLKFCRTDPPPLVKVTARQYEAARGEPMVELTVEDNGIGFETKYSERIFGIFQRLHGRSEYEGTGVGLSICQKIVEGHGGSIRALGRPGEGATFVVTLRARQSDTAGEEQAA